MQKEKTGMKLKVLVIAMLAVSFIIPLGACSKNDDNGVSDSAVNGGNTAAPWLTANQTEPANYVSEDAEASDASEAQSDDAGVTTARRSSGTTRRSTSTKYYYDTTTRRQSSNSTTAAATTRRSTYTTRDYAFTTAKKDPTTKKPTTTEEPTTKEPTTESTTVTTTVPTTIDDSGNSWDVD